MKTSHSKAGRLALATLVASAALAAHPLPPPRSPQPAQSPIVRLGSFNIRCPKDKGSRSWNARRRDVVDLIRRMRCDVIGLQEVTPAQMKYLKGMLSDEYGFEGVFRNGDRKSGEAVPVCYLKSRFGLEKGGTFWLSDKPDKPGSRSWGTSLPRTCSWVLLKDKVSGKSLCFANAHTDHKSDKARVNGVKVVVAQLSKIAANVPVVLVGDHNCNDQDAPAKYLRTVYNDAIYASKGPPKGVWRSFTGWGKSWKDVPAAEVRRMKPEERRGVGGSRIDFIYVSKKGVDVLDYITVNLRRNKADEFYSDHFPVMAKIVIK